MIEPLLYTKSWAWHCESKAQRQNLMELKFSWGIQTLEQGNNYSCAMCMWKDSLTREPSKAGLPKEGDSLLDIIQWESWIQ